MIGLRPIITVLFLVMLTLAGALVGSKHGHPVLGTLLGLSIFATLAFCYIGFVLLVVFWQPPIPICGSGKCKRWKDYKIIKVDHGDWYFQCNCNTKYILKKRNLHTKEFVELLSDGATRPYMYHTRFGRWKPEDEHKVI